MFETSDKVVLQRALIFAVVWGAIITIFASFLSNFPPIVQFVSVAVTSYLLPSIILSGLLNWGQIFNKKMLGTVSLFAAFDLVSFPLLVGFDGVYNAAATTLGTASIDFNVLQLTQLTGLAGFPLFLLTYAGGFLLLVFVGVYLLSDKMLWEILR